MLPAPRITRNLADLLAGFIDHGVPEATVRDVVIDSRAAVPGALFLACAGEAGHGLEHAEHALAAGACAIVYDPAGVHTPPGFDVPMMALGDLSARAGEIAARFYGRPSESLFVAGVTGTDGKTSCAWLIAQAMRHVDQACGYLGTLGFGDPSDLALATHTTPDATRIQHWLARMVAADYTAAALEVSSHALAQKRADAVAFDVAVLTQIGRDHLDYHGDDAAYVAAKRRLFDQAGVRHVVLNADDAHGRDWLVEFGGRPGPAPLAYGRHESVPDHAHFVHVTAVEAHPDGLRVHVHTHVGEADLVTGLVGLFHAANLAACLGVLLVRGIALEAAVAALSQVATVPGRMERIAGPRVEAPLVIVDYAHTAGALEAALEGVRAHARGRVHCVFGCGGDRDRGKRALMGTVAARLADYLWLTDDNPRGEAPEAIVAEITAGLPADWQAPSHYRIEHKRRRAIAAAIAAAGPGDVVLIAGKGHETTQQYGPHIYEFDDRVVAGRALEGA
ncbi:UDP-N-acetylmuramoyl-L-alanyl-D-glutamate--2,6-diaminopimelate ligase [Salinisphaera sp. Q1T1-3]|uniref:UDP-N-acetylmuramoyl-L-alanyl-D-glutamate--2, 6-diaminopimelate ligase n=1 Tax=Salinisphaera sp. Q1T1-3 TaxID=2321229 RepID=UPI000E71D4AC|nr:UDP-N-acetylmuramoyl-L-alanyl-D-glutamate--2,6-diaminopimelate ligase [Salinisphaera sp. Q1T1-3]RJS92229.1 UDP-N-acetylmuramoyl-L-alanyl-D-glutamate--2,6-diaminopimelate ligase [Salinisphaera sp. Q1T1-3]